MNFEFMKMANFLRDETNLKMDINDASLKLCNLNNSDYPNTLSLLKYYREKDLSNSTVKLIE